jgi:ribonuclease Z
MSYIVVGPRFRGKFDAKRAKELGIPNGPMRSSLAKGEAVTFEIREGDEVIQRTVNPEEVVGKSETPGVCFFIYIYLLSSFPTLSYILSGYHHFRRSFSGSYRFPGVFLWTFGIISQVLV